MNFCGPYDKQLAAQYQAFLPSPLLAGWEFRQKPTVVGNVAWQSLAKTQEWALTAAMRRDLLSDKWAVIITDTNQIIQYTNSNFEEMTGYADHEATGRRPSFLQGEGTSQYVRQRMRQAIERQKPVRERIMNYRKDRTTYWCQVEIRPIVNRKKQVVNFIAFEQEIPFDESYIDR
jgi:PAS domain S-box-containing protein